MTRSILNRKILDVLIEKTDPPIKEASIRNAISKIRQDHPELTLNASAQVFAQKRGFSIARYLNREDRDSLKTIKIEKVNIPKSRTRKIPKLKIIAQYDSKDKLLQANILEINKTYTHGCYTASFVLCRKVLENLLIHNIIKNKYPTNKKEDREMYYDFNKNRYLDFNIILKNLRDHSNDFRTENKLVIRICELVDGFKESANEMTHSLYHIANKSEIDKKNIQHILDLIQTLERSL